MEYIVKKRYKAEKITLSEFFKTKPWLCMPHHGHYIENKGDDPMSIVGSLDYLNLLNKNKKIIILTEIDVKSDTEFIGKW